MDMIYMVFDVIDMISKVNLVGSYNSGWWVDTEETRYVCADRSMFHSFKAIDNGEKLYMGNSATDDVKGEGDVILKMTSENELKLTNSDKFVLSKNQMYVGKGYAVNDTSSLLPIHLSKMESGSSSKLDDEVIQDKRQQDDNDLHDERQDQLKEEEVEPRRSKKARTEKSFGPDFVSFMVENEPTSYREAITSSEGHQWKKAIKSEIDFVLQNHTLELVDLPLGCKLLGYKWIFKKKMKADGAIDKYKAILIIKGYRQREGLEYFDTYSLITQTNSIRMDTSSGYVILCLYVDDMLIIGSNDKMIKSKDILKSKFDMKDMGLADVIFRIKIIRTRNGLVLSKGHYVDKILNNHNAGDSGLARTTIDTNKHLSKNSGVGVAQLEYSRFISMVMYFMTGTRSDLAYAVSRLSRYTSNPSVAHWKAMTRISDIKDSGSTSGYMFTLGGAVISWKYSKQTVIAKSTMESEFIALDKCRKEAEWLRQFVEDIPRWPKPVTAISIHYDSQSAIGRAHRKMYNGKSKHIHRRHNSIRQLLSTGAISIDYVKSKDNIVNLLTKDLSRELVSKSSKGMGLKPLKE
uniref:Zinc finger, CCHC-type n=1 Tax=Tanacetum cinerariifolium TaxID=118510 RepID=A0A6L2KRY0_TANCI|nr:zinc finger, CCHC-type [Tanacetum cinerariifolium]